MVPLYDDVLLGKQSYRHRFSVFVGRRAKTSMVAYFFRNRREKAPVMVIIYEKKIKIAKDSLVLHYIEVTLKSLT